jgi:hypothetical protein
MAAQILGMLVGLALFAGPAWAETLGGLLTAHGITPPRTLANLDRSLGSYQVLDDERDVLVVYAVGARESARLHAARFARAGSAPAWTAAPLGWRVSPRGGGPMALALEACRGGLAIERFPAGFLVRAHINPSAECTMVLGPDLTVRGVLAGWPVLTLADGRIVYQRNQVHFASVHPVALALFDPRRGTDLTLYPRKPDRAARAAHVARMRTVYAPTWCSTHNHPCDPDVFDEHVASDVVTDAREETLAFVMAWDNTTGWSDAERWGRLEAFRELRAALGRWDGRGEPPVELYRSLGAGLARTRNLKGEAHVEAALAGEPALAALVGPALASRPAARQDERSWLVALDARWADADTWKRLGAAVAVPEEFTEVVYVYAGLRRPDALDYRELRRRDFEARFGPGAPRRALEPDVLRRIFRDTSD